MNVAPLPPIRPPNHRPSSGRPGNGAFTLVEMLVVIGIVSILAAILLPVLATAKEHALRIKCRSNLKQYGLAFISYANDNSDRLPSLFASDLADHLDMTVCGTMMKRYGLTRDICYCPAYPEFDNDNYWNNTVAGGNRELHRILGYCHSLPGSGKIMITNINPGLTQQFLTNAAGATFLTDASARALVSDMTPSSMGQTDPNQRDTYIFYNVPGENGVGAATTPKLRANHIDGRHRPRGGNEVMLDGHGEWVQFRVMVPRTLGLASPIFWW